MSVSINDLPYSKAVQLRDVRLDTAGEEAVALLKARIRPKGKTVMEEALGQLKRENSRSAKRGDLAIGGKLYNFRSAWERNYARYLQWLKERGEIRDWEYEPKWFEFKETHGNNRYLPDFLVTEKDGSQHWEEIKGYMTQGGRVKINRFLEQYPNERFILIDKEQYLRLNRDLKNLIPGWET